MNAIARQERIQRLVDDIKEVLEKELAFSDTEETERITRWALFAVAREHLDGHVEFVWLREPFPEEGDAEARDA
jgi:hypothetical protein